MAVPNTICESRLEKLGLKKASDTVKELRELKRKMAIAYEHFRFVRPEKIEAFRIKLQKESRMEHSGYVEYKDLVFIPLADYAEVPPDAVLDKIEAAQDLGCFDRFEVAKIESVRQVKDPIVFGVIDKCEDRFFIGQWDDDVKIEDILTAGEG